MGFWASKVGSLGWPWGTGMLPAGLAQIVPFPLATGIFTPRVVHSVVWCGLAVLTVSLLVLARTRWGHSQPLGKCIFLSVLAHLLLAMYAMTVEIVASPPGWPGDSRIRISQVDTGGVLANSAATDADASDEQPWDEFPSPPPEMDLPPLAEAEPAEDSTPNMETLPRLDAPRMADRAARQPRVVLKSPAPPAAIETPPGSAPDSSVPDEPLVEPSRQEAVILPPYRSQPEPPPSWNAEVLVPQIARVPEPAISRANDERQAVDADTSGTVNASAVPQADAEDAPEIRPSRRPSADSPDVYADRTAANRAEIVRQRGGTGDTEAAVKSALAWLAKNQSADGHWDAQRFGGRITGMVALPGKERQPYASKRSGEGGDADTAVTGLAILAFLANGDTQLDGKYQDVVRRGLEYLLNVQGDDGNLGGNAGMFEFMYCHGMAAFALSEAYGMTHDERLEQAVRAAVEYTLQAQHPTNGGWRYQPGDVRGDTSQLGWQLMALKSAELGGMPIPQQCREGMVRFLKSVSSGPSGGLAGYRSGEQASRAMTAEALVCRQFLGMSRENPASDEAGEFLLDELPNSNQPNVYYWYYGTLAMFELQGRHWESWNAALQEALLTIQVPTGADAGSWDPALDRFGGYGGRVYCTALGALCLEVYYRYLPLYAEVAP